MTSRLFLSYVLLFLRHPPLLSAPEKIKHGSNFVLLLGTFTSRYTFIQLYITLHVFPSPHAQLLILLILRYIPIGCNVSPSLTGVSLTENSWMLHPLDKVSLGYCAPDQTIPSLKFRLFNSFLNIILGGFYGV